MVSSSRLNSGRSGQIDPQADDPSGPGNESRTESAHPGQHDASGWIRETPARFPGLPSRAQGQADRAELPRRRVFQQNPSLAKLTLQGRQAYEIDGLAHGPAYRTKELAGQRPGRLIGTSTLTSLTRVMSRKNADSPFHKKITRRDDPSLPVSDDDIARIRKTTNAIAALASLQPELGRHLKVELVTWHDTRAINFITPVVQGQTLQSLMDSPDLSDLEREDLAARVEHLAPVLHQLAEHGFAHCDINAGNIMYVPETGHMVLIDFEKAREFVPEEAERLGRHLSTDMENLSYLAESMRRPPSRQPVTLQFVEQISSSHFDPGAIEGYSDVESTDDDEI